MTRLLTTNRDENLAIIQMDDRRGNTLTSAMLKALTAAVVEAADADAVLLLGRRRVFCGGIDLEEVVPLSAPALMEYLELIHHAFRALLALERPLVVGAAGTAVAGGAVLLCCGDLRIGARDSGVVGFNEVRLGVGFPAAPLEAVRSALNPKEAARALLFGELVNKEEALVRGFFHRLVELPDLPAEALREAKDIATLPSSSTALVKRQLRRDVLQRIDTTWKETNASFAELWTGGPAQVLLAKLLESLR